MNPKNFILLALASYLAMISITLVVFGIHQNFKMLLFLFVILILITIKSMISVYKMENYASSTICFALLLLFSTYLYAIYDLQFSLLGVMLGSSLFGIILSFMSMDPEIRETADEIEFDIKEMPKLVPEIYDIVEQKKENKKSSKKTKKKKKTIKKKKS